MDSASNLVTGVDTKRLLNISVREVVENPYPHIIKDNFLEPSLYARLKAEYPADDVFAKNSKVGARAGRDVYRGDEVYDELLRSSAAWREFYEFINSAAYLDVVIELFGNYLEQFACKVERDKVQFVDYIEPRETLADKSLLGRAREELANRLAGLRHKDELFVRLDLAQGGVGYGKTVHCDRTNRLTSMLVYFCDAREIQMEGGELLIHEHLEKKAPSNYERHPKPEATKVIARVEAKDNRGVFFLCSNNSYHSATPVTAQKGYRNFIYVSVSSRSASIW